MSLPLPDLQYVMFFTPRSGSSWVADVLTRTRLMGQVREAFNPRFMNATTRKMNAASLDEYCAVLPHRWQSGGAFGFQITLLQKEVVFGSDKAFLTRYGALPWVWLVRSDIVLQAISLYKMEIAQISHAPQLGGIDIDKAERAVPYNEDRIRYWLEHILQIERKTEALIARGGITPLRMNYERNMELKPHHMAKVIGRHIGRGPMRIKPIASKHKKIGTGQNDLYADRFRACHKRFLAKVDSERAEMLEKSVLYGPKGSF